MGINKLEGGEKGSYINITRKWMSTVQISLHFHYD